MDKISLQISKWLFDGLGSCLHLSPSSQQKPNIPAASLAPLSCKSQTSRHVPLAGLHSRTPFRIRILQIPGTAARGSLRCCGIRAHTSSTGSGSSSGSDCGAFSRPLRRGPAAAAEFDAHLWTPHPGNWRLGCGCGSGSGRGGSGEGFFGCGGGLVVRAERFSFLLVLEVGGGGEGEG